MHAKKFFNYIFTLLLICTISCSGLYPVITTKGYDPDIYQQALDEKNYSPTNPLAWRQYSEIPGTLAWQTSHPIADGFDVASGGCTWFAHCFFFIRAGLWDPEKDGTLKEFYEKYYPSVNSYFPTSDLISTLNNKISLVTREGSGSYSAPDLTMTYVKKRVKEIYEMGDFAVGYFAGSGVSGWGGHAIFLEGFDDDGNFVVTDGSFPGPDMYQTDFFKSFLSKGDDNPIGYMLAQYHVEGVDSRDTKNLWERFGDGTIGKFVNTGEHGNNKSEQSKNAQSRAWLMSEYKAIGFDDKALLVSMQKMVDPTGEISKREEKNLGQLKTEINESRFDIVSTLNIIVSMVGLAICIYAILLLLAWVFDKSNSLVEGQMLGLLTLQRIYALPKGMDKPNGLDRKKYKTPLQLCIFIGSLFLLGVAIMSGGLYKFIYSIFETLLSWL